ncbi:peptidoglycan D,D-transpeptidase FtsI family protein [Fictibacillus barbaricus]|uniref:Cell division protein FtsI/penicillin-binding protein 2 n=1 Tax=Fictibacillus barbaricus TaxID=182136 RepID=A0ABU1TXI1_9BACL|nr:penicillin-binding protein 2 [Fictibacillus barbaricus]MDR7071870.1 cell division protein FtsI/penicillin-binding protein 2 [Fictibacillus barbaricus]
MMVTKADPEIKKKKAQVPFRLNVLFLFVFLLFSILVLRLGVLQIVNGEEKRLESEAVEEVIAKKEAPRGKLLDSNYREVVGNKPFFSLTYTKTVDTKTADTMRIAKWLADTLGVSEDQEDKITERDKKDYFIAKHDLNKLLKERLSKQEKKLTDKLQYKALVNKITEDEIKNLSEKDIKILAYKRAMETGYAYAAQRVKTNLTDREISIISENLANLPGIDIMADSERIYPYGDSAIFGSVKQIPKDKMDYFVSRQYDRSDLVGVSGLEEQYQEVLRGTKEKAVYLTNPKSGKTIGEPKTIPGQRGKDIVLTLDMELQFRLERILEEELLKAKPLPGNDLLSSAYIVMMNPKTGEVKGIAGKKYKNGKFVNDEYGALYNSYEIGSTIKGATVLSGLQKGLIYPGQVFVDKPFPIAGGSPKSSWKNMGPINDLDALRMSSNVYMFNIMDRMIGPEHWTETYDEARYMYNQFGLGVKTGIDFPNEATGYQGTPIAGQSGTLYDMGIGQFDTYTTMQMVQYVSTIANGGYRIKPHLVKEIREPSSSNEHEGKLLTRIEPEILNKIEVEDKYIDRVKKGFWQVMHATGGTAKGYFDGDEKYHNPSGKTGTAQRIIKNPRTGLLVEKHNLTLVGYAPSDEPEIAFAVVVPEGTPIGAYQKVNKYIGQRALAAYWELREKYGASAQTIVEDNDKSKEDTENSAH